MVDLTQLCQQAAEKHGLSEDQLYELIERVCIMSIENNWSDQKALIEALKCQGIYPKHTQEEFAL